jgi:hypothetical protein
MAVQARPGVASARQRRRGKDALAASWRTGAGGRKLWPQQQTSNTACLLSLQQARAPRRRACMQQPERQQAHERTRSRPIRSRLYATLAKQPFQTAPG